MSKKTIIGFLVIAVQTILLVWFGFGNQWFHTSSDGGHEYVDLGLPSGTLWATCNIGASSPEQDGDYFAWGETETKDIYLIANYKFYDGSDHKVNKYWRYSLYGKVDSLITLQPCDDVARLRIGEGWALPTKEQALELTVYCHHNTLNFKGQKIHKFTGPNGNKLYIPYSGIQAREIRYKDKIGAVWTSSLVKTAYLVGHLGLLDLLNLYFP